MRPATKILPLLLAGGLALGACGGDSDSGSSSDGGGATAATVAAGTQVSANDASRDEITAAITAAGVDNADRWAGEVIEYRPYTSADDAARLREELTKYGPTDATIDQILSALTIP